VRAIPTPRPGTVRRGLGGPLYWGGGLVHLSNIDVLTVVLPILAMALVIVIQESCSFDFQDG
jgi:hypothetical protein